MSNDTGTLRAVVLCVCRVARSQTALSGIHFLVSRSAVNLYCCGDWRHCDAIFQSSESSVEYRLKSSGLHRCSKGRHMYRPVYTLWRRRLYAYPDLLITSRHRDLAAWYRTCYRWGAARSLVTIGSCTDGCDLCSAYFVHAGQKMNKTWCKEHSDSSDLDRKLLEICFLAYA